MRKMIIISVLFVFSGSLLCSEKPRSGTTPRQPSRLAYWLSGQDQEVIEELQKAKQLFHEDIQLLVAANEDLKRITQRVDTMNERATEMNERTTEINNEIQQTIRELDKK